MKLIFQKDTDTSLPVFVNQSLAIYQTARVNSTQGSVPAPTLIWTNSANVTATYTLVQGDTPASVTLAIMEALGAAAP